MKKIFILLPIIGMLAYLTLSSYSSGPWSGGFQERTGITGTAGCGGAGCHGGSTGVTVTIQLLSGVTPVTTYTPGSAYTVRITGNYTSASVSTLPKFGFQIGCVKNLTTTNAGTWGTPPASTHAATGMGINLIEHSVPLPATTGGGSSPSTYVVDIPWTAPAAGTGTVNFKGALNAVDGFGSANPADTWNTASTTITEATATSPGPITGTLTLCAGATTTLADATPGGTWASGNIAVATVGSSTGIVTGVSTGTATISYSTGAGTPATAIVTVNASPTPVTGTPTVCIGATTTLNSTPAGGTWGSSTITVATVITGSGIVAGVASGTSTISYTVSGCSATKVVTVNAAGAAPITGSHTVCVGTTTALSNLTTGGTWSSSVPAKATVGSLTGIVTGVAVGTTMISYTASNGCGSGTTTYSINVLTAGSCPSAVLPLGSKSDDYLSVYPNPSNGTFTINMVSGTTESVNVKIVSLSGEILKEFATMTNGSVEVKIPRTVGMYFVMVNTSTGNYVSKLMVQ